MSNDQAEADDLDLPFAHGDIREDRWARRLVQLLEGYDQGMLSYGTGVWKVEDLLTRQSYPIKCLSMLSHRFNAMEVLAYMENSGMCACCQEDGSRLSEGSDLCGSCYRAACDLHGQCRKLRKETKTDGRSF